MKCADAPLPVRNPEFATHMLNEQGIAKATQIRDTFDDALNKLKLLCIPGREFSLARTKLEEACFFAKKAMAIDLNNQKLHD